MFYVVLQFAYTNYDFSSSLLHQLYYKNDISNDIEETIEVLLQVALVITI